MLINVTRMRTFILLVSFSFAAGERLEKLLLNYSLAKSVIFHYTPFGKCLGQEPFHVVGEPLSQLSKKVFDVYSDYVKCEGDIACTKHMLHRVKVAFRASSINSDTKDSDSSVSKILASSIRRAFAHARGEGIAPKGNNSFTPRKSEYVVQERMKPGSLGALYDGVLNRTVIELHNYIYKGGFAQCGATKRDISEYRGVIDCYYSSARGSLMSHPGLKKTPKSNAAIPYIYTTVGMVNDTLNEWLQSCTTIYFPYPFDLGRYASVDEYINPQYLKECEACIGVDLESPEWKGGRCAKCKPLAQYMYPEGVSLLKECKHCIDTKGSAGWDARCAKCKPLIPEGGPSLVEVQSNEALHRLERGRSLLGARRRGAVSVSAVDKKKLATYIKQYGVKYIDELNKNSGTIGGLVGNNTDDSCEKAFEEITAMQGGEDSLGCYVGSYGRGVGVIPSFCDPNANPPLEKIGLLCYPACSSYDTPTATYKRWGFDCHQVCPQDWADQGLFCRHSEYGRGVGKSPGCGDESHETGGLCYTDCSSIDNGEYSQQFVDDCTQPCPTGFRNDGLYCAKPEAYGRGTGYSACSGASGCTGCSGCSWHGCSGCSGCSGVSGCGQQHCHEGDETWGALCYPKCKAGYSAAACCLCSPDCPSGMQDIGVSCHKQYKYMGPGTIPKSCDPGWELNGLLCYPTCKAGYNSFGCCMCRPPVPDCTALGMNDGIDLSCAKKIVIGAVQSAACQPDQKYDAGLCYTPCKDGYRGVGPVCWQAGSPPCMTNCGAFYAKSVGDCVSGVIKMVTGPISTVGQVVAAALTGGASEVLDEAGKQAVNSAKKFATNAVKDATQTAKNELQNMNSQINGNVTSAQLSAIQSKYNQEVANNASAETIANTQKEYAQYSNELKNKARNEQAGATCIQKLSDASMQGDLTSEQQAKLGLECAPSLPFGLTNTISAYLYPICPNLQPCVMQVLCKVNPSAQFCVLNIAKWENATGCN